MSTRCRIGIQNTDGTITSIYCHFDGYPDYVGKCLVDFYQDEQTIRKLMSLGDLSSLGTEPVDNPDGWKVGRPDNMCVSYKSRGEDCPSVNHKDVREYQKYSRDCWGEYAYLFKNGDWFVLSYDNKQLRKVKNLRGYKESHYFDVVN